MVCPSKITPASGLFFKRTDVRLHDSTQTHRRAVARTFARADRLDRPILRDADVCYTLTHRRLDVSVVSCQCPDETCHVDQCPTQRQKKRLERVERVQLYNMNRITSLKKHARAIRHVPICENALSFLRAIRVQESFRYARTHYRFYIVFTGRTGRRCLTPRLHSI